LKMLTSNFTTSRYVPLPSLESHHAPTFCKHPQLRTPRRSSRLPERPTSPVRQRSVYPVSFIAQRIVITIITRVRVYPPVPERPNSHRAREQPSLRRACPLYVRTHHHHSVQSAD
jgi:hypothetical protein